MCHAWFLPIRDSHSVRIASTSASFPWFWSPIAFCKEMKATFPKMVVKRSFVVTGPYQTKKTERIGDFA